jgi:spore coat protein U-like protein
MSFKKTLLAAALIAVAGSAAAGTSTTTMPVKITIQNACQLATGPAPTLDFGTQGPLTTNIDQTVNLSVTCTTSAPYNVGLDAGTNGSGNVANRAMNNGAAKVAYQLYSDSNRQTVWGNTVGTNTVAGTGNGSAQTLTVYGRVPPQATPAAGVYTDTVNVTVTY